jgi:hypothetical protein
VSIVDEAIREDLSREIYETRRAEVGSSTANAQTIDSDDEDLIGYDSIEPGLPPASSDKRKWWLDNGKPARSDIKPMQDGAIPNPNRPSNPFTPTDEPDWVTVPRMPLGRTPSQTKSALPAPAANPRPASNGPRSLPPPFNSSSVASLTNNFSQTTLQDASSNRPPSKDATATSDRRTSTSSASTTSKKSAPPVGRKPVHLTSSPTLSTSSPVAQSRSPQPPFQGPQQPNANDTGFAPPRRSAASSPVIGTSNGPRNTNTRKEANSPPPPPQPRRPGASGTGTNETAGHMAGENPRPGLPRRPLRDLLDDGDDNLSGWEALKPS